ncbi:unnamed protein product [Peronospora destructor]|uniref:Uncharacterized protein n=1 Tax=Peronospora destructor TaxID=86335 RepID=A0AAV0VEF3_9STRA|nr:unnamed protein product [Peronospora destructor]
MGSSSNPPLQPMRGVPSVDIVPPSGQGMPARGYPPPAGSLSQGPPNAQDRLTQQFNNMGINGPTAPDAAQGGSKGGAMAPLPVRTNPPPHEPTTAADNAPNNHEPTTAARDDPATTT